MYQLGLTSAESTDMPSKKDVVVYRNASQHQTGKTIMKINDKHPSVILWCMFWCVHMVKRMELGSFSSSNKQNKKCTTFQCYKYCLTPQGGTTFNVVHRMGRLFQQYIVDMYTKIEFDRLQYIRHNQTRLHAELYQGLADAIQTADENIDGLQIGKKVILPSSFTAGPRYQHQLYQDAMAIVQCYGKPDFFITFTCNPRWQEITDELLPQQTAVNHPDSVARVFKLKLHLLLQVLYYGSIHVLGKIIGWIHVVEWQKCGPPHGYILAISDSTTKPHTPKGFYECVLRYQMRKSFQSYTRP